MLNGRTSLGVGILMFAAVYLQRLQVPGLGLPILIPVFAAWIVWHLLSRKANIAVAGLVFIVIWVVFFVMQLVYWRSQSMLASGVVGFFGLFAWGMLAVRLSPAMTREQLYGLYVRLTTPLAALAIAQLLLQLLGLPYIDLVALVSSDWLIDGYVSRAGWDLGPLGLVIRSNSMVFLEPSFASQYFALSAVVAIRLRDRRWMIFVAAVFATGSGTGLIALAVGGAIAVGTLVKSKRATIAVVGILPSIGIFVTPIGSSLLSRVEEFATRGSSASQRFVEPWLHLMSFATDNQYPRLTGLGTGEAGALGARLDPGVNYTLAPQAIIEYGLLMGSLVSLVIAAAVLSAKMDRATKVVVLLIAFVLSGTLYQIHTTILVWLFSCALERRAKVVAQPSPVPGHAERPGDLRD